MEPMNLNADKLEEQTGAGLPALILLLSAQLALSTRLVSVSLSCPISLLSTQEDLAASWFPTCLPAIVLTLRD